MMEIYEVFCSS